MNLHQLDKAKVAYFDALRGFRSQGLLREISAEIAAQRVLPIGAVIAYLKECNSFVARQIRDVEMPDPNSAIVDVAIKMCVDSRAIITTPFDLGVSMAIERTAGASVISGHVFKRMGSESMGIVCTHQFCGAEAAAHEHYKDPSKPIDNDIRRILDSISSSVALLEDPGTRSRHNAAGQMVNAYSSVSSYLMKKPNIHPTMVVFEPEPKLVLINPANPYEDIATENPVLDTLRANIKLLHAQAGEEKRVMNSQYAHVVIVYDSTRVPDPRKLCGLLPNEAFVVTVNAEKLIHPEFKASGSSSVGCVKYAISDGGTGHVKGVGLEKGNHFILVVDPNPAVAEKMKRALLSNGNTELRDLTRNGETILLCEYNPSAKTLEFL